MRETENFAGGNFYGIMRSRNELGLCLVSTVCCYFLILLNQNQTIFVLNKERNKQILDVQIIDVLPLAEAARLDRTAGALAEVFGCCGSTPRWERSWRDFVTSMF